ncbi:MAG: LacI family DNA-binding transcriptional regulator [Alphaproteobacteria bacterium]
MQRQDRPPTAKRTDRAPANNGPRPAKVTLKDVAARAGVHASTVSRALKPETRPMVTPDVVRRVTDAATALGYRPNPIASSLRTNRTLTIGVVIPDLTNALFPPIIRGIEDTLAPAGYTAIIANTDNDAGRERLTVERMRERRVDGLILATARRRDGLIDDCRAENLPLVLINRTVDRTGVACIINDDTLGMRLVVDHMAALGHRDIAFVGGPRALSTGDTRHRGFTAAMRAAGLKPDPALIAVADAFRDEAGYAACETLIARGHDFTAVIAANDLLALGCLDAFAAHGLSCPGDVSLTGFNDIPNLHRMSPPLTTVRISHYHMGARAAETLMELIRNEHAPIQKLLLEPELVVRGSTAPPKN